MRQEVMNATTAPRTKPPIKTQRPITPRPGYFAQHQQGELGSIRARGGGYGAGMGRVAIALLIFLLPACDAFDEGLSYEETPLCAGGEARPLSISSVSRALREQGFTVARARRSEFCGGPGREVIPRGKRVVADLTNIHFDGPHENIDQHDEVTDREGHVGCVVLRSDVWGRRLRADLDAPAASPIFSGDKAQFFLANVECTIYPSGDRKAEQVDNMHRVMRSLEASL